MRRLALRSLVAAALAAAAGALASLAFSAGPPPIVISPGAPMPLPPQPGLTASLSTTRAGARPVTLTLTFPAALICGRVSGVTEVTLPHAAQTPDAVAPAAVTINGARAGTVTVRGSTIAVAPSRPHGVTCMSIVEGTAKLVFTPAARLGNPARSGDYPVLVRRGRSVLRATLAIS
jgi:hypothetical protein